MPRPDAPPAPPPESPLHSPMPVLLAVLPVFALVLLVALVTSGLDGQGVITDYDLFRVVGVLVHEGRAEIAYHHPSLIEAQERLTGADDLVPWAYPPLFNLVVAPLAWLPRGLGYGLFTGGTLAVWTWLLWRLAGAAAARVLLLLAPMLVVQVLAGQNGFLTGALAGWFALLALRGGAVAGLPLGLMAIKPHLALGLGVMVLVRRDWRVLGLALAVALALAALATAVMGLRIWPAFLAGAREAEGFLRDGAYQLPRMTSLYATLRSLGLAPGAALVGQLALALAAAGAIALGARRGALPPRQLLALACAAGLLFSPYSYDYDLALFGIALALVAPELVAQARRWEWAGLTVLCWIAAWSGVRLAAGMVLGAGHALAQPLPGGFAPGALAFLPAVLWCAWIVRRAGR